MFWARPVIYNQTCPYMALCSHFLARPIVTNCLCCGHTWLHDSSCTSFGHHTVYACLLCVLLCLAFQGLDKLLQMYWKGIIRSSAIHMWCMLQTSPHHCTILWLYVAIALLAIVAIQSTGRLYLKYCIVSESLRTDQAWEYSVKA